MRFSSAIATAAAVAPFVNAHGNSAGMPQIAGLNMRDLKTRDMLSTLRARAIELSSQAKEESHAAAAKRDANIKRQGGNTNGQCGGSFGNCAAGYCCSGSGWCGNTGVSSQYPI